MLETAEGIAPPSQIAPSPRAVGLLLVHGVTGMPAEMRPLERHFQSLGYRVDTPLLPGHGAGHRELLATTWQDWLEGLRCACDRLAATCDDVLAVGLCGGGLLCTLLAAEDRRITGTAVLSPDLGFRAPGPATPWNRVFLPFVYRVPFLERRLYWTEQPPYGLKDPRLQRLVARAVAAAQRGETAAYGTFRTYVGTLHEMARLQHAVRQRALQVRCPVLILHSVEDTLFTIRNATALYGLLGSRDKSIELLTGCDHVMTIDARKELVVQRLEAFVARLTAHQQTSPEQRHGQ